MPQHPFRTSLLCLTLLGLSGHGSPAFAEPGEVKGQDVMGDKTKSAQDGFSQPPVPREESAAKDAPNPGGPSADENTRRPASESATPKGAGEGPQ